MKRHDLEKHLRLQGCVLLREGKKHSIYYNPSKELTSALPRHNEIAKGLCIKICKDLGIKQP